MWRYLVQRVTTGQWLHTALPATDVEVTSALSAPGRLSGTVPAWLVAERAEDGLPLLDPWSTAIWAEDGQEVRGGGVLHSLDFEGDLIRLDVAGVSAYPQGLPWQGPAWSADVADPLDVWRRCWADIHGRPLGDFFVTTDELRSPVRVGSAAHWRHEESGESRPATTWNPDVEDSAPEGWEYRDAEPVELSPWATPDVGDMMARMVEQAGADWIETNRWTDSGRNSIAHHIRLGLPLGVRRDGLRLAVGENVTVLPEGFIDGDEIADEVQVRGAGEGAGMVVGTALQPRRGRLPRVKVLRDPAQTDTGQATTRARSLLPAYAGAPDISRLSLVDHPHAPIGSFDLGDLVPLISPEGAFRFDGYVRVMGITYRPEDTARVLLDVTPEVAP